MSERKHGNFGGDWTEEKLARLAKYLPAYTTILKGTVFKYAYIDAFAGPGYRSRQRTHPTPIDDLWGEDLDERGRFTEGSAVVAMRSEPPRCDRREDRPTRSEALRDMAQSTIEWTESTWNPVTGCDDASPGCENCYARRMAHRLKAMGAYSYRNGFELTLQPQMLERPLRSRKPQRVFVNSMSDLFHVGVPKDYVHKVFDVMVAAHWHQFQVLTKRSGRLLRLSKELPWPKNIWMGVSVENADYSRRIDHLRNTGAHVKFLSLEPLIGPLPNLDLRNIDWVIVGGESGPGARPMDPAWVREIRDQCTHAGVPFFFKQWGGVFKKRAGRKLDQRTWDEYPALAPA